MNSGEWNFAPVMKNPVLEQQLKEDGYVVIKGFLDQETVSKLISYNTKYRQEQHHDGIFNSVWHSNDVEYKKRTLETLINLYTPFCEKYFKDHRIFGGSYISKPPHGKGESNPHIDFGIVDESVYRSFSLWLPLVPMREDNGALRVLKGSHRLDKHVFRGPNIPDQTIDIRDWLWEHMDQLFVDPGDAVIYDHKAIHGSKDNFSDVDRIAATAAITNANAEMVLYFWEESAKKVFGYNTNPEYLLTNSHDKLPTTLEIAGEWNYEANQLTLGDLGIEVDSTTSESGIMHKIRSLFQSN